MLLLNEPSLNVNSIDEHNESALSYALKVEDGNFDIIKLLLAHGATIPKRWPAPAIEKCFERWPITMIIILKMYIGIYYIIEASSIIDIYLYI
jgi:hypothetical protein